MRPPCRHSLQFPLGRARPGGARGPGLCRFSRAFLEDARDCGGRSICAAPIPIGAGGTMKSGSARSVASRISMCMLSSRRLPTRQMLVNLIAAFDAAPTPLLLKCSGGQDRTSFAAALYLLHRKGWAAADEARAHSSRAGPICICPSRISAGCRLFVEFARENAAGRPLGDWIARKLHAGSAQGLARGARTGRRLSRALRQARHGARDMNAMMALRRWPRGSRRASRCGRARWTQREQAALIASRVRAGRARRHFTGRPCRAPASRSRSRKRISVRWAGSPTDAATATSRIIR